MACLLGRDQMNLTLLSLRCAIANRFMNFRHIGNGTECASLPSLINPIPPDSTVFCLRGAIASTTSDFVFKFRAFRVDKKNNTVDTIIVFVLWYTEISPIF